MDTVSRIFESILEKVTTKLDPGNASVFKDEFGKHVVRRGFSCSTPHFTQFVGAIADTIKCLELPVSLELYESVFQEICDRTVFDKLISLDNHTTQTNQTTTAGDTTSHSAVEKTKTLKRNKIENKSVKKIPQQRGKVKVATELASSNKRLSSKKTGNFLENGFYQQIRTLFNSRKNPQFGTSHRFACTRTKCQFCIDMTTAARLTKCTKVANHRRDKSGKIIPCHPTGWYPHIHDSYMLAMKRRHDRGAEYNINRIVYYPGYNGECLRSCAEALNKKNAQESVTSESTLDFDETLDPKDFDSSELPTDHFERLSYESSDSKIPSTSRRRQRETSSISGSISTLSSPCLKVKRY